MKENVRKPIRIAPTTPMGVMEVHFIIDSSNNLLNVIQHTYLYMGKCTRLYEGPWRDGARKAPDRIKEKRSCGARNQ